MPRYAFLSDAPLRIDDLGLHLTALRRVGVPYSDDMIDNATADARAQATPESPGAADLTKRYGKATNIGAFGGEPGHVTEMDALVAYLQIVGRLTDVAGKTEKIQ